MAKSPVGIEIYKGKQPKWKVGKQLGTGACATVHQLDNIDGSPTEFAIKLAPLPKKITKKQNSKEETNQRLLSFENTVYHNQVQDLQGTFVPKLPPSKGPPAHGTAADFTFLVIEKMARPLHDVVTLLAQGRNKTIPFGPIAAHLVSCVEAIHERKNVVVDIKPDNFMLAVGDDRKRSADQIAKRIRILDLALVQPWASIGSHRSNDGISSLVGTPMYTSLNVHNGETPSRRDDLEALGYVIAELLIKLSSGDSSKQLPWSEGKSDDEIGTLKESYVSNAASKLYKDLGSASVAKDLFKYISEVRAYSFKKVPDYEALKGILMETTVTISTTTKAARAKKTQQPTTRTTRSTARGKPKQEDPGTTTTRKRTTRATATKDERSPAKMRKDEAEAMDIDYDEDVFHDTTQGASGLLDQSRESFATAAMDWEIVDDENQEPTPKNDLKPAAVVGLEVIVESGPHKGERFHLMKDMVPIILVGRNPTGNQGEDVFVLCKDDEVDSAHIRMELCKTKKLLCINVTDLNSSSGSFVGSDRIRKGKEYKVFRGQSVKIGNSLLSVHNLNPDNMTSHQKPAAAQKKAKSRDMNTGSSEEGQLVDQELPRLRRKGVALFVVEGPHKGDLFELEHGGIDCMVLGSKPSSKIGQLITLKNDSNIKATHLKLELVVQKKMTYVSLTDKSKGNSWVNRDKVRANTRAFINDQITIGDTVLQLRSL